MNAHVALSAEPRSVASLSNKEKNWLRVRHCGFCEAPMLGSLCYAYSGKYELPVIKGVRDKPETIDLGPKCNMDVQRGKALATYKPRNRKASPSSSDPDAIAARFWAKVDKRGPDECWNWTADLSTNGYGRMTVGGKVRLATHVALWLTTGSWPERRLCACHHCDNRTCVNPSHLFLGTIYDNNNDKLAKGRQSRLAGERNPRATLTWADVHDIRASSEPVGILASRYGVSRKSISNVRDGTTWRQP